MNKVIRLNGDGFELEADPRQAEIVAKELGLERAKSNGIPGAK